MTPLELQKLLTTLGYYHGALDGIWGQQSITALKSFQSDRGLLNDGVVGTKTIAALKIPVHANDDLPPTLTTDAVDNVKAWEGLGDGDPKTVPLEIYWDIAGYATAGYGHLVLNASGQRIQRRFVGDPVAQKAAEDAMRRFYGKPTIDRDQAKALLSVDLNACLAGVAPLLQGIKTDQAQLNALVSFAFNVGVRGLGGSTVLVRHKAAVPVAHPIDFTSARAASKGGQVTGGMERAFGAWSNAGGEWVLGIFRRRMSEALLYDGTPVDQALAAVQAIRAA